MLQCTSSLSAPISRYSGGHTSHGSTPYWPLLVFRWMTSTPPQGGPASCSALCYCLFSSLRKTIQALTPKSSMKRAPSYGMSTRFAGYIGTQHPGDETSPGPARPKRKPSWPGRGQLSELAPVPPWGMATPVSLAGQEARGRGQRLGHPLFERLVCDGCGVAALF